jgi:tetratricopeptide (TPR) repeat protein
LGHCNELRIVQYSTGSSWQNPNKWQDYVDMMEEFMLTTDKDHYLYSRWVYYMAQTYAEVSNLVKALEYYEKRTEIKNGLEDIYISYIKIAELKHRLGYDINEVIYSYLKCTKENPYRIEHFIPIINHYISIEDYHTAYVYSSYAVRFAGKNPEYTTLLIDSSVYNWRIYDLHNITSWWSGRIDEAKETFVKLWEQVEKGLVIDKSDVDRLTSNKVCNMP